MPRVFLALVPVAAATLLLGVLGLLGGLLDRSGRFQHRILRVWGRFLLRVCGVEVVVSGLKNVPSGPAVFAANHASALDIPILFGCLPVEFRIIHKRSLYWTPLVGWYLFLGGHIAIERGQPFRAKKSLLAAAQRIRRGTSVAVFPEGTRSPDESVRIFKRGSFVLALNAGVPLVPVSLAGVKRVIPRGFLTLRPGTVRITVHPAISTAGRAPEEAERLADEVRAIVLRGCGLPSDEARERGLAGQDEEA